MAEEGEKTFQIPPTITQDSEYRRVFASVLYFSANNVEKVSKQLEEKILKYVDRFVYVEGRTSFEAYREIQALIDDVFADFHLQARFKGIDANKHLVFVNQNGAEFGVDGLSDGERQVLAKVFPLFAADARGRVILMDEPEESLHPSWQSYLLPVLRRCAKGNDCQFVLATHSPQIISSAHREEVRLLTRDAEGRIQASVRGRALRMDGGKGVGRDSTGRHGAGSGNRETTGGLARGNQEQRLRDRRLQTRIGKPGNLAGAFGQRLDAHSFGNIGEFETMVRQLYRQLRTPTDLSLPATENTDE